MSSDLERLLGDADLHCPPPPGAPVRFADLRRRRRRRLAHRASVLSILLTVPLVWTVQARSAAIACQQRAAAWDELDRVTARFGHEQQLPPDLLPLLREAESSALRANLAAWATEQSQRTFDASGAAALRRKLLADSPTAAIALAVWNTSPDLETNR